MTWKNSRSARELTAAADVLAAQKAGELSLASPGIVINMPFLDWPSGHRWPTWNSSFPTRAAGGGDIRSGPS